MPKANFLKGAMNAAFAPDGRTIYVLRTGSVDRLMLTPQGQVAGRDWSARVNHPSHLTPASDGAVLVVTTTAGTHLGLDPATGTTLWTVEGGGEGDAPVLLEDGLLFASWGGVITRLDPATGDVMAQCDMGHRMRGLQRTAMGVSCIRIDPPVDDHSPPTDWLCTLDPATLKATPERPALGTDSAAISADGKRIALSVLVVRPGDTMARRPFRLEIRETGRRLLAGSRRLLAERLFDRSEGSNLQPRWSPDARWLTVDLKRGHAVLDARTLQTIAELPCAHASGIVWSPDSNLICACSWEEATLLPVGELSKQVGDAPPDGSG